jgi:hypothetical protein
MMTKRFVVSSMIALICAAGLMAPSLVGAQAAQQAKPAAEQPAGDSVALARAGFQGDRKQIVAANMELTPDEAAKFWPVYDQYRASVTKVNDRLVALILGYSKNYTTLTDAQATQMVDEYMKYEKEKAETRSAWTPKFAAVLPPKKLARFVQVENKIDALVNASLAQDIPLVK